MIETEPLVRYRIHVRPDEGDNHVAGPPNEESDESEAEDAEEAILTSLSIGVTYPPTYPECLPQLVYEDIEGLTEEEEENLKNKLNAEVIVYN